MRFDIGALGGVFPVADFLGNQRFEFLRRACARRRALLGELADQLEHLGTSPYDNGWMIKVKLTSDEGLGELSDYATYQKPCAEEQH